MPFTKTVTRLTKRYGSAWTLQRRVLAAGSNAWTAGALTQTYFGMIAQGREARPEEIAGGLQQGDWIITVDPMSLAVTPNKGDRIAAGTFSNDSTGDWLQIVDDVRGPSSRTTTQVWKIHARR